MNIPNQRNTRVRVFVDRFDLGNLTDSDGAYLVDSDDALLGLLPTYRIPIEITDRVRRGRVSLGDVSAVGSSNAGVDSTVTVLSLTLDHGEPSLAPGVPSILNTPDELMRPYRPIRVIAYDAENEPMTLFSGYLGDEIRSSASAGRASLTITARDLAKPLQDTFLSEFPVLAADATPAEPRSIEDVIHELLALIPIHLRPPFVSMGIPPFFVSEPYRPQNCSVWDAMQQLAIQAGLYLGVVGEELVLLDPPRDKTTPDLTLDTDDAFTDDLGISDTDVRNAVRVVYTDPETLERHSVEMEDEWSIENITGGIKKMSVIELDVTSQIDTQEEAEALATRFISDMSREFASTQLNLPFLPRLWLFGVVEMTHPKFTQLPRTFAVHSVEHTFDRERRRTVVAGVGQVVGKRRAWLHLEPRPGSPNDPRGPHQSMLPPPIVTVEQGNPGMVVTVQQQRGVDAHHVEIHWSLVNGFIPSPLPRPNGTLAARGVQEKWVFASTDVDAQDHIVPGVDHFIRVRSVDSQGVPGRWTQQFTIKPAKVDSKAIVLDGNVEVTGDFHVQGENVTIDGDTEFFGDITLLGDGNTGTFRVKRGANIVLALGHISGFPGVPPTVSEGLWGALGTGVFILGALELVEIGEAQTSVSWSMTAGEQRGGLPTVRVKNAFTVPAGETWYVYTAMSRVINQNDTRLQRFSVASIAPWASNPSTFSTFTLEARSYTHLDIAFNIGAEAITAGTKGHVLAATYFIVKRTTS